MGTELRGNGCSVAVQRGANHVAGLHDQWVPAKVLVEIVEALVSCAAVTFARADRGHPLRFGSHVCAIAALDPDGRTAGEALGNVVEGEVFAVEVVVDVVSKLHHEAVVGRVVIQESNVNKRQTGQDHVVIPILSRQDVVHPALVIQARCARPCADQAISSRVAPGIERKVQIFAGVVCVVVAEEDCLCPGSGLRLEFLVEAVDL